ncbi:hypothetical protein BU15DRAFT_82173 [Melanogaster broomeanus]|nr:hypothetical protein BU15DRAFT_82173 [Melanogaster broomeanus]
MFQSLPNQHSATVTMGDSADEDVDDDNPTIKSSAHNPTGKNQYSCVAKNDSRVNQILREYQRHAVTSCHRISQLLLVEHNIKMSPTTVARRRKDLNLQASGATTRLLSSVVKRQLVLDELAQDPLHHRGPQTVREGIAATSNIFELTHDLQFCALNHV